MGASLSIDYWVFLPQIWVVICIFLVVVELFDGNMVALPVGVAAIIMAAAIHGQNELWFGDFVLFDSWRTVMFYFATLSLVCIGLLKYFFQFRLKKNDDVNEY